MKSSSFNGVPLNLDVFRDIMLCLDQRCDLVAFMTTCHVLFSTGLSRYLSLPIGLFTTSQFRSFCAFIHGDLQDRAKLLRHIIIGELCWDPKDEPQLSDDFIRVLERAARLEKLSILKCDEWIRQISTMTSALCSMSNIKKIELDPITASNIAEVFKKGPARPRALTISFVDAGPSDMGKALEIWRDTLEELEIYYTGYYIGRNPFPRVTQLTSHGPLFNNRSVSSDVSWQHLDVLQGPAHVLCQVLLTCHVRHVIVDGVDSRSLGHIQALLDVASPTVLALDIWIGANVDIQLERTDSSLHSTSVKQLHINVVFNDLFHGKYMRFMEPFFRFLPTGLSELTAVSIIFSLAETSDPTSRVRNISTRTLLSLFDDYLCLVPPSALACGIARILGPNVKHVHMQLPKASSSRFETCWEVTMPETGHGERKYGPELEEVPVDVYRRIMEAQKS
ncbi:unnamed protein product [Somion occarium]|uniref:Uncharacterized protein n=1 Tax=Somion occarium TaxID=3059160 RepID=A0ABP1E6E5_9APHY